ncbi:MAG: presenilin family intramembrane aspartyl protease [Candidatus Aenigmatarchaeota archaeon]
MQKNIFIILIFVVITQILGIYAGYTYYNLIKSGAAIPPIENPYSIENSFYLFFWIIFMTIVILIVSKFWKGFIFSFEPFLIFLASFLFFDIVIQVSIISLILAAGLTLWKTIKPSFLSQNISSTISGAGAGAIIGLSFDLVPCIVFLLLLSTYDIVAVFITKHMISLAKLLIKRPTSFMFSSAHEYKTPRKIYGKVKKVHVFHLGLGDVVFPLALAVSSIVKHGFIHGLFCIFGCWISLILLFYYMKNNPSPLPALPFVSVGSLSGIVIANLLF